MRKFLKRHRGQLLYFLICLCAGAALGAGFAAADVDFDFAFEDVRWLTVLLVSTVISMFVQIILHEAGHMVCGLLTGYRFVSFRVGSLMLVRTEGKLQLKRFSLPGTGGQCLLDPPEMENGTFPTVMYNLGGGLANLLTAAAAAGVFVLSGGGKAAVSVLIPFAAVGLFFGVMNLVPLKVSGIANDGYNILSLGGDMAGKRALWLQLRINRLQSDGLRLRDMDESWFVHQDNPEGNPLVGAVNVMGFQRLIDEKRFDRAAEYGRTILRAKGILPFYAAMIRGELLYMELTGLCRPEEVERLYSREQQKFFRTVKNYPSTHRILFAYAVRYTCDSDMADRELRSFEQAIKHYPVPGEIELEKELMEVI